MHQGLDHPIVDVIIFFRGLVEIRLVHRLQQPIAVFIQHAFDIGNGFPVAGLQIVTYQVGSEYQSEVELVQGLG